MSWRRRSVTSAVGSPVRLTPTTLDRSCRQVAQLGERVLDAPGDDLEVAAGGAVADQPEVQLPAIRENGDVEGEVPRQRGDRVHLEHPRAEAVQRRLRS